MGIFPEDFEISVFQLVSLWVAEGIIKPIRSKSLEDVAEEYLLDLIDRNLILGVKRDSLGKIKTCKIHDLLRDLCVRQSKKDMFFHLTYNPNLLNMSKGIASPRIIVLPSDVKPDPEAETLSSLLPTELKSFLSFNSTVIPYTIAGLNSRLVRVFYIYYNRACRQIAWEKLVSLRYLYFPSFLNFDSFASVCKLRHLQTLIVKLGEFTHQNIKIWEMQELRHVMIKPDILLDPPASAENEMKHSIIVLKNLQTLTMTKYLRWTNEMPKRIPNLKKLGIFIEWSAGMEYFGLKTLVCLHKLEELKFKIYWWPKSSLKNLIFPPSLVKLTLIGGVRPWDEMKIVGKLPNLQVLKLKQNPTWGTKWELEKGGFLKLKVLLLDKVVVEMWIADSIHFPELQRLVIKNCRDLKIPSGIGEIPTLQSIELFLCGNSVITSAKQIQEEQESLGNDNLRVLNLQRSDQS